MSQESYFKKLSEMNTRKKWTLGSWAISVFLVSVYWINPQFWVHHLGIASSGFVAFIILAIIGAIFAIIASISIFAEDNDSAPLPVTVGCIVLIPMSIFCTTPLLMSEMDAKQLKYEMKVAPDFIKQKIIEAHNKPIVITRKWLWGQYEQNELNVQYIEQQKAFSQ